MTLQRLCVFAGSGSGARPEYETAARELGALLASRRIAVVYGGARTGLMGVVADAALRDGGEVIGIIPEFLVGWERAHQGLSELVVVDTMHARKAQMAKASDAFIALPGGTGTLDELIEMLTWDRLGIHDKPIGLLSVVGYWEPLLAFLRHATREQFMADTDLDLLSVDDSVVRLVDTLDRRAATHAPAA
jgi:uncharacterized protein (TIGR00730 family)